jgi:uncharacterized protein YyaL (SSP411 family)
MLARFLVAIALSFAALVAPCAQPMAAPPAGDFPWKQWSDDVFERARRENKFVLLSLQSWWCPWCHTMNETTYADAGVRAYIEQHYIPVRVDQDSRPDISQRYERWGWPATVLFGPDGTEIVKLRGYYSPQFFMPILQETVKDPSPVDYGEQGGPERARVLAMALPDARRAELVQFLDKVYDRDNDGWGKSKLVDLPTLTYALERARTGDKEMETRVRGTLTRMIALIDKDTGAIGQITKKPDWSEPSREFPMFAQQAGLAAFSTAWVLWRDPAHRAAADRIFVFMKEKLASPEGGFYTSMGMEKGEPGVDKTLYARETGQAIAGLLAYYDATGVAEARGLALRAAQWALRARGIPGGGFRHAAADSAGPYLADSLYMAQAFIALYRSTSDRRWLAQAQATGEFMTMNFVDERTGGFPASTRPIAPKFPAPVKQKDDNVAAVRMFNLLHFHTGEAKYRALAEAGMGYLASPPVQDAYDFLPDVLLAEMEVTHEPVHVTVVGARRDPRSGALYRAALAYPTQYKRAEWWDKADGKLPNHDVDYPDYPEPAAFACTRRFCSEPVTDPAKLAAALDALQRDVR